MSEQTAPLTAGCSFMNIKPAMADLPYPPLQAESKNQAYASLLSNDYCGSVSELSAIAQYINHENRLSEKNCAIAKVLLGIGMAEMIHLQKLGELIVLLGGTIDFTAKQQNGKRIMWTPSYLSLPETMKHMLAADIESEKGAIRQYQAHQQMIRDPYINAVLSRIIQDEEYHIMLLQSLLRA